MGRVVAFRREEQQSQPKKGTFFLDFHGSCVHLAETFQECPNVGPTYESESLREELRHARMWSQLPPCRYGHGVFRLRGKAIVILANEEEYANGGEGTEVPLIAHVHSKEPLFLLSL